MYSNDPTPPGGGDPIGEPWHPHDPPAPTAHRTNRRGLWWLLVAAALPWLATAAVLVAERLG